MVQMRRQGIEQIQALRPDIHIVWMPDTIHDIPFHRPAQLAQEILSPQALSFVQEEFLLVKVPR